MSTAPSQENLRFWNNLLPRDGYKEGTPEEEVGSRLVLLDTTTAPIVKITVEELQAKWIDICIEQSRPKDMDHFCLKSVLPMLLRDDSLVMFTNKTAETAYSGELYVTEQELKRLWAEASLQAMGKGIDKFTIEEALLLLTDDEDDMLLDIDNSVQLDHIELTEDSAEGVSVVEDKTEYFVSTQELQRIWSQRSSIPWGMPAQSFDEKLALLLLDEDDDDTAVYTSAIDAGDVKDAIISRITYDPNYPVNENAIGDGEPSNKSPAAANFAALNAAIESLHLELDDPTYQRPAWRKDRHILTPDIDTQRFMGDLMMSNTYMTSRIPANWLDPETEEMSEFYLASDTMALPGEPETDFNLKRPIWEMLNMPQDGYYAPLAPESAPMEAQKPVKPTLTDANVDWSTFDFEEMDKPQAANPIAIAPNASNIHPHDSVAIEAYMRHIYDTPLPVEKPYEEESIDVVGVYTMPEPPRNSPPFVTPPEWLQNPEFKDHAGIEEWEKYDINDWFGADEAFLEEDVYYIRSLEHLRKVTDEYLVDHSKVSEAIDDLKYWNRHAYHQMTGSGEVDPKTGVLQESIPNYWTPDKDRGVEYSNEVIEMKSKLTLHVEMPPPAILFQNDTFGNNEDFVTMNKIGTIRVQYNWRPDKTLLPHVIDQKVVEKIKPVLDYVNHCAELLSTKDGVLVFDYFGQMRHVIGIRDSMLHIAKQCYPEVKVSPHRAHLYAADSMNCEY